MSWESHAEQGQCEYCGKKSLIREEPFGQKPACQPCWELICFGDEDD